MSDILISNSVGNVKTTIDEFDDRTMKIWDWCSSYYLRYGRRLSFPKNTDIRKTYQWRYVTAISKKFMEWDFDNETSMKVLQLAISHSHNAGTLQKGLTAILQNNIIDICLKELKIESDSDSRLIGSLKSMNSWFSRKLGDKDYFRMLLEREDEDALCNFTNWYQSSLLSPLYISLSKSCMAALSVLTGNYEMERELLPTNACLYLLRSEFTLNKNNVSSARDIFAHDWR